MNEDEMMQWYANKLTESQVRFAKMILADLAKSPLVRFHPQYEKLVEKYQSYIQ